MDTAFGDELHLRQHKAVYLIQPFFVASVGREETVLTVAGKGDTKIISRAVERSA